MYALKEQTKKMSSFLVGTSMERFINFDYDEEIKYINGFKDSKCTFIPESDERVIGRGNPLLARNEFLTIDEVNKWLDGEK
ncbi:MAG: hypothetical protein U0L79_07735 [Lachnospiraceae bacterium]|nr:hypothetical protein [Lachnospiraceae bacterium]